LEKAGQAKGCAVRLLLQPVKSQVDFAEEYVLDAIEAVPDAVVSLSADKLGKDGKRLSRPLRSPGGKATTIYSPTCFPEQERSALSGPPE
jgi:hypothetical protein